MADETASQCPQCGKEILGGFENCAYCGWAPAVGAASDEEDRLEKYWYPAMWGMAFFLIPVGIGVGLGMAALWSKRYPRKARQMERLNLVAHLTMVVVVILGTIILSVFFRPYLESLVQSYLAR